jgi:hypothetical protein
VVPADPERKDLRRQSDTAFVGFYRWHVHDPVMFATDLRVTIQQIGAAFFLNGEDGAHAEFERTHPVAGEGWVRSSRGQFLAWGITERVDDYCATDYVYCSRVQAVPRLAMASALADIARLPWETARPLELLSAFGTP